jgi:hypothetical protein
LFSGGKRRELFPSSRVTPFSGFLPSGRGKSLAGYSPEDVWGIECDVTTRTVDQHVVRLRQKIEDDPSKPVYLLTAHGAGYRFSTGKE